MVDDEDRPKTLVPRPPVPPPPVPIDDCVDHVESESLNDFIIRLAAAADSQRLRVPVKYMDDQGNLLLTPVIAYFVDSSGTPHSGFDTTGYLQAEIKNALTEPVPHFPGGNFLSYKRKALNDGSNAGNHVTKIEPQVGSPVIMDFMAVWNMDTSSRNVSILLATSGGTTADELAAAASISAGEHAQWPAAADIGIATLPLTSAWEIEMLNAAVAVSQDTYFFYQLRYFGTLPPTVTETGPTGVTWSDVS